MMQRQKHRKSYSKLWAVIIGDFVLLDVPVFLFILIFIFNIICILFWAFYSLIHIFYSLYSFNHIRSTNIFSHVFWGIIYYSTIYRTVSERFYALSYIQFVKHIQLYSHDHKEDIAEYLHSIELTGDRLHSSPGTTLSSWQPLLCFLSL